MNELLELEQKMLACEACDLFRTRTKVVFGSGSMSPKVMLVGEAPGEDEDLSGQPFVGKAGKKLDSMLGYAGLKREDVYISNSVLCRPPLNRNPSRQELNACKWRLDLQIKLLKPKLIIVLGKIAAEQIKGEQIKGPLKQLFPENLQSPWVDYNNETKMIVTYHPSFHLRSPEQAYKITLPHWTQIKEWVANGS